MVKAFGKCYQQLKDAGVTPILQYLYNEVSNELIATIKDKKLQYQLASPHDHQVNPAERAIQTFKNHFIANLQGCDKRCPKYLWCQFIPQTVMTVINFRPLQQVFHQIFPLFLFLQYVQSFFVYFP